LLHFIANCVCEIEHSCVHDSDLKALKVFLKRYLKHLNRLKKGHYIGIAYKCPK
jgi:hypothetical protein